MWLPLNIKDYILKTKKKGNGCEVYISDLRNIWFKKLENEEIVTTVKKLNPVLDAPPNTLIEITLGLFNDSGEIKREVKEFGDEMTMELVSKIGTLLFTFQLNLQKGDCNLLFKEFTLPLLLTTKTLQAREKRLIDIIKRKDAEIAEYKVENVTIKRTHVITQPFLEKEFNDQEECNSSLLDVSKNPSQILDKTCQNMLCKVAEVIEISEKEKLAESSINIKEEPSSISNNESPDKIADTQSNGKVKEEKGLLRVETFDVKRRKIEKKPMKLKI